MCLPLVLWCGEVDGRRLSRNDDNRRKDVVASVRQPLPEGQWEAPFAVTQAGISAASTRSKKARSSNSKKDWKIGMNLTLDSDTCLVLNNEGASMA